MNLEKQYRRLRKLKLLFLKRPQKLLFEHVPKCGGTTVKQFLRSQYPNNRTFSVYGLTPTESIRHFKSLPQEKRYRYDLVIGHAAHQLRDYVHPDTLKTTILRDPVDRLVSHYYFAQRAPKHALHREVADLKMPLAEYVRSGLHGSLRNNYVTRFLEIPAEEAEKNPEEAVESAYRMLRDEYAIVGLLEDLEETLRLFADTAGFHNIYQQRKRNVTGDRPRMEQIDPAALEAIREVNFLDILLYERIRNEAKSGLRSTGT